MLRRNHYFCIYCKVIDYCKTFVTFYGFLKYDMLVQHWKPVVLNACTRSKLRYMNTVKQNEVAKLR